MSIKMISFLGSNKYTHGTYELGDKQCDTNFIQIALADILQPEEVYVLVTKGEIGSRRRNWEGIQCDHDGKIEEITGLKECSQDLSQTIFHPVDIPEGKNIDEIWGIFNKINECIEDGDTIIFDVTHSFRSIPIIGLTCIQYLRVVKNIKLQGIYYGAWEARIDNNNIAPIIELTSLVDLMDWSHAVRSFDSTGNIVELKKLLDAETLPRRKESKGQDKEAVLLYKFANNLENFINSLATCRGEDLYAGGYLERISSQIAELKKTDLLPAIEPLLDILAQKIDQCLLSGSDEYKIVRRGFEAAKWCAEHGQIQQAYTILRENILTYVCLLNGQPINNREYRENISWALQERAKSKSQSQDSPSISLDNLPVEIFSLYDKLSQRRNDLNHAGITIDSVKSSTLTKDIEDLLQKVLDCLKL